MNNLEEILLNVGFSWQLSVILPFVIILVLGVCVGLLILKRMKLKILRSSLSFVIGIAFCCVYFAFYPIYISDLDNEFRIENHVSKNNQNEAFLEVLVLPDCPHCIYSTDLIKKLALRNIDTQIVYKIVSNDGYGGGIEEKLKIEGLKYTFSLYDIYVKNLTKGSFPSFVFHEKGANEVQVWNNNTFGSNALDYIEAKLVSI